MPSGQLVTYQYQQGVLIGIQVKNNRNDTIQLVQNIKYNQNGIKNYTFRQTQTHVNYQYDIDGRLLTINDPMFYQRYQYDIGNRITQTNTSVTTNYQHDKLDRLINQISGQNISHYVYDNNSNRTQKTVNGVQTLTPVKTRTNQYQNYQYDKSGKVLNDGIRRYQYHKDGRLKYIQQLSAGGNYVFNQYNPLGQRTEKLSKKLGRIYFNYDETGKLVGEYDETGKLIREYIYLGNRPIGMMTAERPHEVLQIHTDHLETPRVVTNAKKQIVWCWEGDAFGDVQPQVENVKMPLRMAGQYADDEVGLFYNYFRFYDPATGRYIENDPIDLQGGLNRYGYVGANPLHNIDPKGLFEWSATYYNAEVGASFPYFTTAGYTHWWFILESKCKENTSHSYKVKTMVISANAGVGIGLSGKFSASHGTGNFDDNNGKTPNPYAFEGKFIGGSFTYMDWFPGKTNFPVAKVIIGSATGDLSGSGYGTDVLSLLGYGGISILGIVKPRYIS